MDAKKEIKVLDVDFIISDLKRRIDYNNRQIENRQKGIMNGLLRGRPADQINIEAIRDAAAANCAYTRILELIENIGREYVIDDNGAPCFDQKEIAYQKSL